MIDLRSDTITQPTEAMRRAMAAAEVGDDVYGEDPTINTLEQRAAEILGKESGLFVPTGTMANTIAVKLHTEPGQEIVCEQKSHIMDWELGMTAWFSSCQIRPVATADGLMTWDQIEPMIRTASSFWSATAMLGIEHPHNMWGGTIYEIDDLDTICAKAHERGLKVHLDGARIFNASAASGLPVSRIAANADTVMFCLSKGLAAPVGSILAGSKDAITRGRLFRKRLGGAMRQAGVLAAAGMIALEEMPKRLHEDHANAKRIADRLAEAAVLQVVPAKVRTNCVVMDIAGTGMPFAEFNARLMERGVRVSTAGGSKVRALTHLNVSTADCDKAADIIAKLATGH